MQHKLIKITLVLLFSYTLTLQGQKLVNSPYSRFNIGSLAPVGSNRSLGMGGVGTAFRSNNTIYSSNPASYSSLDTNSFVFDFGIDYGRCILSDGSSKYTSQDMNFDHLVMGFPLAKGWGVALGVVPLSSGFYNVSETVVTGDAAIGDYISAHSGSGGFTNLFVGSGIKLNKNFSAGVNMTVLFGQVNRSNLFVFNDLNVFNSNTTESLQMRGINFSYGLQYTASLKNDYFLNAGVSLNSNKYYNAKYEQLSLKYTAYNTKDTISYVSNNSEKAYIPGTLRTGISVGKKNKFTTGIDYEVTNWSQAKIPGLSGTAADTRTVRFGMEYIPDKFSNYSFFKRIEYRIGGHTGNNYLIINGDQLKEKGASIGLGLPLRRSLSKINVFLDYTKKSGSSESIMPAENYYSLGISMNLFDFWFIKRKYD
jgi:hypothetical protein